MENDCEKQQSLCILMCYSIISSDGLRKPIKFCQDSRPLGRETNPGPLKCEAGVFAHSVQNTDL
jgi:hypothetical protein